MRGRELDALFTQHGGIVRIITHPAIDRRTGRRGWANTVECADGFTRQLTIAEENSLRAVGK
jgi:hypothetical protein